MRTRFWQWLHWLFVPERALIVAAFVVSFIWFCLYLIPAPIPPDTAFYDKAILYIIAVVFTTAVIVMLISRRTWTFRAMGILLSMLAIAVLSWNAVYIRQAGYHIENGRVVSNISPGVYEAFGDLWRSLFLIGGPLFFIGLLGYLYGRYGPEARKEPFLGERRQGVRRDSDKKLLARVADMERQLQ